MDKFWTHQYPPGVRNTILPLRYASLVDFLEDAFTRHAGKPAYSCLGVETSYAEVDRMSRQFAAWLQAQGLSRGARVALMMPNIVQYPVAMAGVIRAGMVAVNINPLYTPRELEHQLRDCGAEVIVVLENFCQTLEQVMPRVPSLKRVVVTAMGDLLGFPRGLLFNLAVRHVKRLVPAWYIPSSIPFRQVLSEGRRAPFERATPQPDQVAVLQYTGGTTGISKGAILTHRNLLANVAQCEAWLRPGLEEGAKGRSAQQVVSVCALPMYHIFAFTVCGLMTMLVGALVVLIPNPRDLQAVIRAIEPYRVTVFPAVNTLFNALAAHADFARLDFSELRISIGGGMAVSPATAKRWLEITGCPICEGYGLSETSPVVTCTRMNTEEYSGTIGLPLPDTDIRILAEDGSVQPRGEPGELVVRGPQVMAGYWNQPDETRKVMTPDGYFRTGDVAVVQDDGQVRLVDRKKDMILVSGFNVYPSEIEAIVSAHPGVLECAAVGVPDSRSGEAVHLYVVRRDPELNEKALLAYCAEQFTGYKRPRVVVFQQELPKSTVGKILRRVLREEAATKPQPPPA